MQRRVGHPRRNSTIALILIAVGFTTWALILRSTHPWWYESGDSSCSQPVSIRVSGHVTTVGGCGGDLNLTARKVSVRVGQRIDMHVVDVPLPTSTNTTAVQQDDLGHGGSTATYRALRLGTATLMTTTIYCASDHARPPVAKPCPVIRVVVTK